MVKRSLFGVVCAVGAFLMVVTPVRAQLPTMSDVDHGSEAAATGPLPEWDVAVIKPHPPEDGMMSWRSTPDGMSLVNLPLEELLCNAWDVKSYQLSGLSGWMKSGGYDLTAKVSADDLAAYKKLNAAQRREMLQKLLEERFHLKTHMETKTMPVYDLVVDKGGSKLKVTTAIEPPSEEERKANPGKYKKGFMTMGQGMFEGTGVPVRSLASQLSNALEKPVHDATGLTGNYDIRLKYKPEETAADSGADVETPSVFLAVQEQLGLKLVAGKGPVEMLVVDAAEKPEVD